MTNFKASCIKFEMIYHKPQKAEIIIVLHTCFWNVQIYIKIIVYVYKAPCPQGKLLFNIQLHKIYKYVVLQP